MAIPRGRSVDENLDAVVEKTREILQTDTAFIALCDDQNREVYMKAFSGINTYAFKRMRFAIGKGMGGRVAAEKVGHIVYDYYEEMAGSPVLEEVRGEGLISGIAVPMRSRGVDLGVLYAFNRSLTKFPQDDLATVTLIANLAAVEISRSIYAERLRQAHSELESRVNERTASLLATKKRLEKEIVDRENLQEALIESEKRYRRLVESANDIIFSCDLNGNFSLINPVALRITGYSVEQVLGRRFVDFVHPDHRDGIEEFYEKQLKNGVPDTYTEYPIVSKDGRILWLGQIVQLVTEGGKTVGFQAISRDITKRKEALKALEESEQKFRMIFEHSPVGIFHFDHRGVLSECNEKIIDILGSSREKLLGMNLPVKLHNPDLLAAVRLALSGSTGFYEGEYSAVTGNKVTPIKCVISPVIVEGHVASGIGIMEDITERKEAEKQLLKSKEMVEAILNASADVAFLADIDGRILFSNETMAARFSSTVEEMCQTNCFDLIDPETADIRRERFAQVIREQKSIRFEDKRSDFYIDHNFYPVFDSNGKVVNIAVFSRDITEQKKSEQVFLQSERFKAVAGLAAGVAHNFNNLLQVVMAGSELVLHEIKRGNVQNVERVIKRMLTGCKFGAETVKRLQEFAGVSNPKDRPKEIMDVSDFIRQGVEITKPFWKNTPEREGIYINLNLDLKEGCFIVGKKHEMFEVVVNLIKNAVEAMPDGGDLDISCERIEKNVVIKIKDSGLGVSPENVSQLFTPFFTTKLASGAGLGLATTRKIINEHGGSIFVTSELGLGATFTINLPFNQFIPTASSVTEIGSGSIPA